LNSSTTLLPPVRRRSSNDIRVGLAFLAGTTVGAGAVGVLLTLAGGLLSPVPETVRLGLAAAAALAILAVDRGLLGRRVRLPQTPRQIPSVVVAVRRPGNAWRFAVPYGTGLRTYLPSPSPHVLAVGLVLVAPSWAALAAALAFGAGRGLSLLVRSCTRDRDVFGALFDRMTALLVPLAPLLVAGMLAAATLRP
jgi:hypothetical protein